MARKQVLRATRIPSGQVDGRAVLEGVADRVQDIGLDPEWVTGLAGPDPQARRRSNDRACFACRNHGADCMWIGRICSTKAPHYVTLLAVLVALVERNAVGDIFDRIAVEIYFEFVHSFGMVPGHGNGSENGVTHIDHKRGACFAAEYVEVRDVEADVLPGDWRVEVM